jgi:hypothetical protein
MMTFASDTLIAVPVGTAPINTLKVGDRILAASIARAAGAIKLNWSVTRVGFSDGTGGGVPAMMIYITYLDGNQPRKLICTTDQPLLLASGQLEAADRLTPSQQLLDRDGGSVAVQSVTLGGYIGGVHNIATDVPWSGNPNGHLLLAGGIVAGDYILQVYLGNVADAEKDKTAPGAQA